MKQKMISGLRYLLTAPMFLGWLFPILMMACYMAHKPRMGKDLVLMADWRPWITKYWRYSTTLSRGMVMQPTSGERTLNHEHIHVAQVEDCVILGLILGLIIATVLPFGWAIGFWVSSIAWQLPNYLGALLRGHKNAYRWSLHEMAAYAITNDIYTEDVGKSWIQIFEEREIQNG